MHMEDRDLRGSETKKDEKGCGMAKRRAKGYWFGSSGTVVVVW